LQLVNAQIGDIDLSGAIIKNGSGPALQAEGLRVDQNLYLAGGFRATGKGEVGALQLVNTQVAGSFTPSFSSLHNVMDRRRSSDRSQLSTV
jgi:hypothetical protein